MHPRSKASFGEPHVIHCLRQGHLSFPYSPALYPSKLSGWNRVMGGGLWQGSWSVLSLRSYSVGPHREPQAQSVTFLKQGPQARGSVGAQEVELNLTWWP